MCGMFSLGAPLQRMLVHTNHTHQVNTGLFPPPLDVILLRVFIPLHFA